jgi:hypothetical protein
MTLGRARVNRRGDCYVQPGSKATLAVCFRAIAPLSLTSEQPLQDGDEQITQLAVIHDGDFHERVYTVSADTFRILTAEPNAATDAQLITECIPLPDASPKQAIKQVIADLAAKQPYLGGCARGRVQLAERGADSFEGHHIQMWDPTEAAWFQAQVLGMCKGVKLRKHWFVKCSDDTEYPVHAAKSVWRLVRAPFLFSTRCFVVVHNS